MIKLSAVIITYNEEEHLEKCLSSLNGIADEIIVLEAGQSIKINKNTRVQYSNPFTIACEYIAICLPAFSMNLVDREEK